MKNIPIPSKHSYLKCMIGKIETLIKRMHWKSYFFDRKSTENIDSAKFNFGFKSDITPPPKEHLHAFENNLYDMMRGI